MPVTTRETTRLQLRPLSEDDWPAFLRLHDDERVMVRLGGRKPAGVLRAHFDQLRREWSQVGFGWWACLDRERHRLLGRGGLRRVVLDGAAVVELAYAIDADHWGKGLATELVQESLAFGFEDLGLDEIHAWILPSNPASRRVLMKMDFRALGLVQHAGEPHELYGLRRTEWHGS